MKTIFKSLLLITFVGFFCLEAVADGHARQKLSVQPHKIYPKMVDAAETGDWEKLSNALKLLKPLSDEIKEKTKKDIDKELRTAIANKQKSIVKDKVLAYMGFAIKSLLHIAQKESNPLSKKGMVKQAFTEFTVLADYFNKIDSGTTAAIMDEFRIFYTKISTATSKQEFITTAVIIRREIQAVLDKLK